jgi:cullin 4
VVTLLQTVVLLLFNKQSKLSYKEIIKQTGIDNADLSRTLQSLACAKVRVLSKTPKSREIEQDDVFEYNESFSNSLKRITINQIQAKETPAEQSKTTERVIEDRQYAIDACIVRILKTRKQIQHRVLVTELLETLKFAVQV